MKPNDIYQMHADICKSLSNSKRLQIIEILGQGKTSSSQLISRLKINKVTLSQNMKILLNQGIARSEKRGKSVQYQLADSRIIKACRLMREVLISRLTQQNKLLTNLKKGENI